LNERFCVRVSYPRSPKREASDRRAPFPRSRRGKGSLRTYQDRRGRSQPYQICIARDDDAASDRTPSRSGPNLTGEPQQHRAAERPASFRFRVVQWLRAVPIRWRILSIAGLNSAVVVVLAVLIWN